MTFRSSAPEVPLPSPEFLEAHVRIAEILKASGIAVKIDKILAPYILEPRYHLAPDGSTDIAALLSQRMLTDI